MNFEIFKKAVSRVFCFRRRVMLIIKKRDDFQKLQKVKQYIVKVTDEQLRELCFGNDFPHDMKDLSEPVSVEVKDFR